jgi:hypothetical protein
MPSQLLQPYNACIAGPDLKGSVRGRFQALCRPLRQRRKYHSRSPFLAVGSYDLPAILRYGTSTKCRPQDLKFLWKSTWEQLTKLDAV